MKIRDAPRNKASFVWVLTTLLSRSLLLLLSPSASMCLSLNLDCSSLADASPLAHARPGDCAATLPADPQSGGPSPLGAPPLLPAKSSLVLPPACSSPSC